MPWRWHFFRPPLPVVERRKCWRTRLVSLSSKANETKVFGISTDNTPSQKEFATKVNAPFPLLSDFANRGVAKAYGVLIENLRMANRAAFVVDKEGKIAHIEEGKFSHRSDRSRYGL